MRKLLLIAGAAGLGVTGGAIAQNVSGGTSGGITRGDLSVNTSGNGSTNGTNITVGGTADATANNGGTTNTQVRGHTNDHIGMQRSTATARDADERARSATHTWVRQGQTVRSRTMTMYHQRGQHPVHEVTTSRNGTTTTRTPGSPH
jgi:hypothetical protein